MQYLNYQFEDDENFISTFDELPLWSASFGLLLLKHLELKPNLKVLDLGSGAGFPLMELAARLGSSCQFFGLDPWTNANQRAKQKIKNYNLSNVEIIEQSAAEIPFDNNSIDLIVSNLGINNFENPDLVFKECQRVLKPKGKLVLTTNLNGHWATFYRIFEATLLQIGKEKYISALQKESSRRGTIDSISTLFTNNNLSVSRYFEESFDMKFLDGTAFLNHYFIQVGWLTTWIKLFPKEELQDIFQALEQNLNTHARLSGGLTLSVPMAYMEGEKQS